MQAFSCMFCIKTSPENISRRCRFFLLKLIRHSNLFLDNKCIFLHSELYNIHNMKYYTVLVYNYAYHHRYSSEFSSRNCIKATHMLSVRIRPALPAPHTAGIFCTRYCGLQYHQVSVRKSAGTYVPLPACFLRRFRPLPQEEWPYKRFRWN